MYILNCSSSQLLHLQKRLIYSKHVIISSVKGKVLKEEALENFISSWLVFLCRFAVVSDVLWQGLLLCVVGDEISVQECDVRPGQIERAGVVWC